MRELTRRSLPSHEALGRLASVERGRMSALAGKAQKWEGHYAKPSSADRSRDQERLLDLKAP
jgi:hypothetical protein